MLFSSWPRAPSASSAVAVGALDVAPPAIAMGVEAAAAEAPMSGAPRLTAAPIVGVDGCLLSCLTENRSYERSCGESWPTGSCAARMCRVARAAAARRKIRHERRPTAFGVDRAGASRVACRRGGGRRGCLNEANVGSGADWNEHKTCCCCEVIGRPRRRG